MDSMIASRACPRLTDHFFFRVIPLINTPSGGVSGSPRPPNLFSFRPEYYSQPLSPPLPSQHGVHIRRHPPNLLSDRSRNCRESRESRGHRCQKPPGTRTSNHPTCAGRRCPSCGRQSLQFNDILLLRYAYSQRRFVLTAFNFSFVPSTLPIASTTCNADISTVSATSNPRISTQRAKPVGRSSLARIRQLTF